MLAVVRSELVRLRRPRMLIFWFGLMALFRALVDTVMFGTASSGTTLPAGAPGVRFPDAATLADQMAWWPGWPRPRACSVW